MTRKQDLAQALRGQLDRVMSLRSPDLPAAERADRTALRAWQSQRLARTYRDLLESPRYRAAAEFFLGDLYGPKDCSARDAEVARVIPVLTRMLPERALQTLVDALHMDALSESLDADMVACLRVGTTLPPITAAAYAVAYRRCGREADRTTQIDLIGHIGADLDHLTHLPLLASSLSLMRKPAQATGLGALHSFLYRGFHAFRDMHGADEFLARIVSAETDLMRRLLDGDGSVL